MLTELRKVVPSFLKRVDLPERGVRTSAYWTTPGLGGGPERADLRR